MASAALLCAPANAPAFADIPSREPVRLPGNPKASATHIHGLPAGRLATGRVTEVATAGGGSRVTVVLDTPFDGVSRVTDEIPSAHYGETTQWTDDFDAVQVGDRVAVRVSRAGGRPALTGISSATREHRRGGVRPDDRWTSWGPSFRPATLPHAWNLQAALPDFAIVGVMTGVRWWQDDPDSFWRMNEPGALHDAPSLGSCSQGVPPTSWVRFGAVREAYDGAIGVAMYCSDGSGRSSFEAILDYRVDYDLDLLAAHEVGHGIAFHHSDDPGAVMYPIAYPKDGLNADDIGGLRTMYPGRLSTYAVMLESFLAPVAGDPGARRGRVRVLPVGEPGAICDRGSVRLRVDPPSARASFRAPGYDPSSGIAAAESNPSGLPGCEFRLDARPIDGDDAGPGTVTFMPLYPGTRLQEPAQTFIELPRPPKIAALFAGPLQAYPGDTIFLTAEVSDPEHDLAAVAWDTDADGAFDDASGRSATADFSTPGTKAISVRATDEEGLSTVRTVNVTIVARPAPPPRPPPPPAPPWTGTPDPPPEAGGSKPSGPGSSPSPTSVPAGTSRSRRITAPLRIIDARISRARRLRLRASFTARANSRNVRVTVRARGWTHTYYQVIRDGQIRINRRLARSQVGAKRVGVTLHFGGSRDVFPASASVRLR